MCHSFSSKEEVSFNFIATVTVHSDLGAQENKIYHGFHFSLQIFHEVMEPDVMILIFLMLWPHSPSAVILELPKK